MKEIRRNKCMIWTRVSSQEQVENGSLNTQLIRCTEYARELGFKIIDHESAYESAKEENIKFKTMIKKLSDPRNKYDAIIVLYASRFSRNLPIGSNLVASLKEKGIFLHVVNGKLSSEDDNGALTLYHELIKANQENHERKTMTIMSRLVKLKQGVSSSKPPLGYVTSASKGTLDIKNELLPSVDLCPTNAPLINKAFKLILQKKTLTDATKELNSLGLKISRKYLGEILRKPFYCGKIIDKTLTDAGIPYVMGKHKKIVSVSTFDEVQKLLSKKALKRKKKTNEGNIPLNGILKCYKCNNNLAGYLTKGIPYYKCNHSCKLNISGKEIHEKSNQLLGQLKLRNPAFDQIEKNIEEKYQERYADSILQQQTKKKELTTLRTRLENLLIAMLDGIVNSQTYGKLKQEIESQIASLETELETIKIPKIENLKEQVLHLLSNPQLFYEKSEVFDKKAFLKVIITSGLTYHKEKKVFENTTVNGLYDINLGKPTEYSTAA